MKRTCWVTAAVASIAALALSGAYQPVAAQKGGHRWRWSRGRRRRQHGLGRPSLHRISAPWLCEPRAHQ